MIKITSIFFSVLLSFSGSSQEILEEKSAKKAAIYSAIIPGAGQVYTRKYWKVPIVYGSLLTSVYFIHENQKEYNLYKTTSLNRINGDASDNLEYTDSELITLKDYYRRNRDVSYFSFISIYILNIIDASVNAHLFKYDVSDDISINLHPIINLSKAEVSLTINF